MSASRNKVEDDLRKALRIMLTLSEQGYTREVCEEIGLGDAFFTGGTPGVMRAARNIAHKALRAAPEPEAKARAWQCSGCRFVFPSPWQKVCPSCGRTDYWSGSVDPMAPAWPGKVAEPCATCGGGREIESEFGVLHPCPTCREP